MRSSRSGEHGSLRPSVFFSVLIVLVLTLGALAATSIDRPVREARGAEVAQADSPDSTGDLAPSESPVGAGSGPAMGREESAVNGVTAGGDDTFHAVNLASRLLIDITPLGVRLAAAPGVEPFWRTGIDLAGYGFGDEIEPLGSAHSSFGENEITFDFDGLSVKYVNGAEGLRQTFTFPVQLVGGNDGGELQLGLVLSGDLSPTRGTDSQIVDLSTRGQYPLLRYGMIRATDGSGNLIPMRAEARKVADGEAAEIRVLVDPSDAVFPITIEAAIGSPELVRADRPNDAFSSELQLDRAGMILENRSVLAAFSAAGPLVSVGANRTGNLASPGAAPANQPLAAPANDVCSGAIVIPNTFPNITPVVNSYEATSTADPGTFCATTTHSLWYSFVPAVSGTYRFTTCPSFALGGTSGLDAVMSVWKATGACTGFTSIACSDYDPTCPNGSGAGNAYVSLTAGTQYYVVAGPYSASPVNPTNIVIYTDFMGPESIDTCTGTTPPSALAADRTVIGSLNSLANNYTITSPSATCFPIPTGGTNTTSTVPGRDAVYSFTPAASGKYSFRIQALDTTATSSSSTSNFALYTTTTCPAPGALTCDASLSAANRNTLTAPWTAAEELYCRQVDAGNTVYVFVDEGTALTSGGSFTLEVTTCSQEGASNDAPPGTVDPIACGIEGTIAPAADKDFFSLGAPSSGSRVFAITDGVDANNVNFDMRVTNDTDTLEYDEGDNNAPWGSTSANIEGRALAGMASYLRVNQNSATAISEPYRVHYVVQPPGDGPGGTSATLETNDAGNGAFAAANVAANGYFYGTVSATGNGDAYRFCAASSDLVQLGLDGDPLRDLTPINTTLQLYDFNGLALIPFNLFDDSTSTSSNTASAGNLAGTTPTSPGEGGTFRARYTGAYYAAVFGGATGDYLLSISKNCRPGSVESADLTVSKSNTPSPVTVGTNLTYSITVTNNGPDIALDAMLTDALPLGTAFQSIAGSGTGGSWSCAVPAVGAGGTVSCTNSCFSSGGSFTFVITVRVSSCLNDGVVLSNTAVASTVTTDGNAANNSATSTTIVSNPFPPINCDDSDACTTDSCNPATDACDHVAIVCNDGNTCTDDSCDGPSGTNTGCAYVPADGNPCTDSSVCTTGEHCSGGACVSAPVDCNDGNSCTQDLPCDPVNGCIYVNLTGACDLDTDACTLDQCGTGPIVFSENFDGVAAPALPSGWTTSGVGTFTTLWTTVTDFADSPPNAAFTSDEAATRDKRLDSPSIPIATSSAKLTFRNRYATESGWDGMVLEISIGGGAFTDILAAGGSFSSGAYNTASMSGGTLSGRAAWSGSSSGFITTVVNLPAAAAGKSIVLRWRAGSDSSGAGSGTPPGTWIDSVTIIDKNVCVAGPQKNCDEPDACTTDACDPATGNCSHQARNCDDGKDCTIDTCNSTTGCVNTTDPALCDDHDPCTVNGCDVDGHCTYTPVDCNDNNVCTNDVCNPSTGVCEHPLAINCDDGLPCTDDSCDPITGACSNVSDDTNTCTDGDVCTTDACVGGVCVSSPRSVTYASTDPISIPESGASTPYPATITVPAGDGKILSVEVIVSGLAHTYPDDIDMQLVGPTGTSVVLMSDAGGSNGLAGVNLTFSDAAAAALPDSGAITSGSYKPTDYTTGDSYPAPAPAPGGVLLSAFNGTYPAGVWKLFIVDDTGGDSGSATGFSLRFTLDCDDNSLCTTDACDPVLGCVHAPVSCDDGLACTLDSCDPASGCVHVTDPSLCDDQDPCTVDTCTLQGTCDHTPFLCDDANSCTDDLCVPFVGCQYTANDGNTCTDNSECTSGDHCSGGACVTTPVVCNDLLDCTDDTCDPATGCVFTNDDTNACSDGNACTADHCDAGACISDGTLRAYSTGAITINDGSFSAPSAATPYPSTITVPSVGGARVASMTLTVAGLSHTYPDDVDMLLVGPTGAYALVLSDVGGGTDAVDLTFTLDDSAASAIPDSGPLVAGTFQPSNSDTTDTFDPPAPASPYGTALAAFVGTDPSGAWSLYVMDDAGGDFGTLAGWSLSITLTCDDGNACTSDSCDSATGCVHSAVVCDDHNPCTTDSCDPASGCVFANDDLNTCTDNDLCTTDACVSGACVSTPIGCDDGNACTADSCDPGVGCINAPLPDDTPCGDGSDTSCDNPDSCLAGSCVINREPDGTSCQDGNLCTVGDACVAGACIGQATTVVTSSNLSGWAGISRRTATGTFVVGPPVPPLGVGSYQMATGPGGSGPALPGGDSSGMGGKTWMGTELFNGTLLSAITELRYSTFIQATASPSITVAINLFIDLDGNGTRDTTMVFEPVYTYGNPSTGVWQEWDAVQGGNAKWWFTTNVAPWIAFDNFVPLGQIFAAYPSARIVTWYSGGDPIRSDGWGFNLVAGQNSAGGPWNDFVGNVDRVRFAAGGPALQFDFDPTNPCDDESACTIDSCDASSGACVHTAITCNDGNLCTTDTCNPQTGCVYTPIGCDDGNACTDDACDTATGCYATNDDTNTCSDASACTDDACVAGTCVSTPITCDDSNVCTANGCDPGTGCVYPPVQDGTACGDPDDTFCDGADTCLAGVCVTNVQPDGTACDDGNFCTVGDVCTGGSCACPTTPGSYTTAVDVYLGSGFPDDTRFDWSSAYNGIPAPGGATCSHRRDVVFNCGYYTDALGAGPGFVCSVGFTAGRSNSFPKNPGHLPAAITSPGWYTLRHTFKAVGDVLVIDMEIVPLGQATPVASWTTYPSTDPGAAGGGIILSPAQAVASPLSPTDFVSGPNKNVGGNRYGWFVSNELPVLALDNSANSATGFNQGFEVDNAGWTVFGGSFNATRVASGSNGIASAAGSFHAESQTAATNWGGYQCAFPVTPCPGPNCDDGSACTTDSCDPATGCVHTPITCDDGSVCTTDSCEPQTGCVFTPIVCDDGNACTDDACDAVTGCYATNDDTNPCDDENACTENDACSNGACAGTAIVCDDANPCTADGCDPDTGCVFVPGNPGALCRTSAGPCDLVELCTGTDAACPPDLKSTAECRAAAGACDLSESCDGVGNDCPADVVRPSDYVCRPSAGECDVAETCGGGGGVSIYDSIPGPLPFNVPSLGYQATSTTEFGDHVTFAGTERYVTTATVTMSTWALHSTYPAMNPAGWSHPITLNLYAVDHSGPDPAVGALLHSVTQTFAIPWRPEADPTCPGGTAWRASDGACYNGYAFDITFHVNFTVPGEVIFGVVYNTANYGPAPIHAPGPYESLNVGLWDYDVNGSPVPAGTDNETDALFWNTSHVPFYTAPCPGGTLCRDTVWYPYTPAVRFEAVAGSSVDCPADGFQPTGTGCSDGNACTTPDECDGSGGCVSGPAPDCDDHNPCTDDSCDTATGCVHTPNNGNSCSDGNACTSDACVAGTCVPTPVVCDDGNACTDDLCNPASGCYAVNDNTNACSDGNACTTDSCLNGFCQSAAINCNDGDACTNDSCDPGLGCRNVTVSCDDSNACTTDSCDRLAGCSNTLISCLDTDKCTNNSCDPAMGCVSVPVVCNDNNACTTDVCLSASGCSYTAIDCSDGDACTNDSCNPASGCQHATVTCNDNDACTNDTCLPASGCSYGPITCFDGNSCTTDSCNPATGCVYGSVSCNDNNPCTDDSCVPGSGCVYVPNNGNSCSDGNACTTDACVAGTCVGTSISCNDNNPCTDDSCNPATGCVVVNDNTNTCSDGSACTTDACVAGTCVGTSITCNDGNACTDDSCNPASGCVYVNDNGNTCSDGNACTTDACVAGTCTGTGITCNDSNACTDDSCNPGTGCVYTPDNTNSCTDGNACTTDSCSGGACHSSPSSDTDGDGVCSPPDNCPTVPNPSQADADNDGLGDACDPCSSDPSNDVDGDGVCGGVDNCPSVANGDQSNLDGDAYGDACDPCPLDPLNDVDGDGVCANADNCPTVANGSQANADGDTLGDACDACPLDPLNDVDHDGVCGNVDNCPTVANPSQSDSDHDGLGDACDVACPDTDGDGVSDCNDACDNSILDPTVIIPPVLPSGPTPPWTVRPCNTGVPNLLLADGCTISDKIAACDASTNSSRAFERCVKALTKQLKRQHIITERQRKKIDRCAKLYRKRSWGHHNQHGGHGCGGYHDF